VAERVDPATLIDIGSPDFKKLRSGVSIVLNPYLPTQ